MQLQREENQKAVKKDTIQGIIGAVLLVALYAIASNMAYTDCLKYGVC